MKNKTFFLPTDKASLLARAVLLASLTAGVILASDQAKADDGHVTVQVQATAAIQDDYDYYPGYETYYNRNRHEYVYRDGNAWVRRPAPQGVTADVLLAAPSVRMDFHDAPEQHHTEVVKSYPRNWVKPGNGPNDKRDDRK